LNIEVFRMEATRKEWIGVLFGARI
jgi:hypothetical protein